MTDDYVASASVDFRKTVGGLSLQRGVSGNIETWNKDNSTLVTAVRGWVLVEMEPIKYHIENMTIKSHDKSNEIKEVKVDKITKKNDDNSTYEVTISWIRHTVWGKVPGIVTGLPVNILGHHVVWGIKDQQKITDNILISCNSKTGEILNTHNVKNIQHRYPYFQTNQSSSLRGT